ncbi:GPI transamidase component PIG-T isoform X2 [Selaginella moellendorffii]|uniref:GPI transamidase component PIG-T isoform X2 n=1 Tax=Selaginella moellendorffii TaxID=88036 RepID=UPI000D1CC86A|nr:GPI transamidase component PIG-T isoform X2 [Selaginella moellendorffii]|eukprot:XP_024520689.1 GPI transamidase component PIG-T isoform X2 [Selaginella moellendorffii]
MDLPFALAFVLLLTSCYAIDEDFSEELLLRPLPDGNVLAHFHFASTLPPVDHYGVHHRLFPKAIFQLVRKFRIKEMELSFTQGRWNYQRWGVGDPIAQLAAKPVGVELTASLDVPEAEVDSTWGNLTHALSGLFCASINFLESPTTFLEPWFSWRPEANWTGGGGAFDAPGVKRVVKGKKWSKSSRTRYGALPREAVCTENLTPWLKLLPCRDKAGLTTLLDRPTIYSGMYHSQRLIITSGDFDRDEEGTTLEQTLTVVLRKPAVSEGLSSKLQDWTLSGLFGSKLEGKCPLATTSSVYLELEESLAKHLAGDLSKETRINFVDNRVFSLSSAPSRVLASLSGSLLLEYEAGTHSELDLGVTWRAPVDWSPARGRFYTSRYLAGSGNARGSIVISFRANDGPSGDCYSPGIEAVEYVDIMILQMIPWYVRLYGHTLQVSLDGRNVEFWSVVRLMRFTPAEDRKAPAAVEIALRVSIATQAVTLTIQYDKGFLHIDEHPPDANRGFDLPSAVITFPRCRVFKQFQSDDVGHSHILAVVQSQRPMQIYSEVSLMQLATPDFSMPYNVITLTCTVLALYFGSLLNALRRRIGEEERESKEGKKAGLLSQKLKWLRNEKHMRVIKVILVVIIGVAVNHYLSSS